MSHRVAAVEQTFRRVFHEEQVPAAEKIVSLFGPDTAIIRSWKAHFYTIWIGQSFLQLGSHIVSLALVPRPG